MAILQVDPEKSKPFYFYIKQKIIDTLYGTALKDSKQPAIGCKCCGCVLNHT